MTEEKPPSLEELGKAIDAAKERQSQKAARTSGKPAGDAMSIGIELMSGVLVGVFSGYWLDKWLDTSPVFFMICFILGVAGSGLNIYRIARKASEEEDETQK